MRKFILFCLVSMMLVTPQKIPFAKAPISHAEISVDTSTTIALLAYQEAKFNEAKYLTDKIRFENNEQLKNIKHKIDSIFKH